MTRPIHLNRESLPSFVATFLFVWLVASGSNQARADDILANCSVNSARNCLSAKLVENRIERLGEVEVELENLCADSMEVTSVVDLLGENIDRSEKRMPLSLAPFSSQTEILPLSITPQERGSLDPRVNVLLSFRGRRGNEPYPSSSDLLEIELVLPSDDSFAYASPPTSGYRSSLDESSFATGYDSSKFRVCFEQRILFDDGGVGEYYWSTDSPTTRRSMYNKVRVYAQGKKIFSGYLNKNGCTRKLRRPKAEIIEVEYLTKGKVKAWEISVSGTGETYRVKKRVSEGSKTVVIVNRTDARNVYIALAMALKRQYVEPGKISQIKAYAGDCSATAYLKSRKVLNICNMAKGLGNKNYPNHLTKKFTIVHELGHLINHSREGLLKGGYDSYDPPNKNFCDPEGDDFALERPNGDGRGAAHATTSTEVIGVAVREGFATFYAAEVFNRPSKSKICRVNIGRFGAHNCGGGKGDKYHPMQVMNTNCDNEPGIGNETDWARTFWDHRRYHTSIDLEDLLDLLKRSKKRIREDNISDSDVFSTIRGLLETFTQKKEFSMAARRNGVI